MGLFNFFMKGVGFSDKDNGKKKKQSKAENSIVPEQNTSNRYSNFDKGLANTFATQSVDSTSIDLSSMPFGTSGKNVLIYAPKGDKDLQLLIECLRRQESCIVNLGAMDNTTAEKVLDFLSGAVYALRGTIKRLQGDLFLLTPEGVNIMTQNNSNQ